MGHTTSWKIENKLIKISYQKKKAFKPLPTPSKKKIILEPPSLLSSFANAKLSFIGVVFFFLLRVGDRMSVDRVLLSILVLS